MRHLSVIGTAILALGIAAPNSANAGTFFYWSTTIGGSAVSGQAEFSVQAGGPSGYELLIQLTNTATVRPPSTANLLTGVMFDITSGDPATGLILQSAIADLGLLSGTTDPQSVVDPSSAGSTVCGPHETLNACSATAQGGWESAYSSGGFSGWPNGANYGIGTAGFGIFNGNDTGIQQVGQANYGITPQIGIGGSGGGVYNQTPYAYYIATFTLSGLTTSNITIGNVTAAYGTAPEGTPGGSLTPPGSPPPPPDTSTPEPQSLALFAGGAAFLTLRRFRK